MADDTHPLKTLTKAELLDEVRRLRADHSVNVKQNFKSSPDVSKPGKVDRYDNPETELSELIDAVESMDAGFILYDAHNQFIRCNSLHRSYYPHLNDVYRPGITRNIIVRRHAEYMAGLIPDFDIEDYCLERGKFQGIPRPVEEIQLADGRWLSIRELLTSSGGLVSVRTDVTDRKNSEAKLHESEARFRASFQFSHGVATITDIETGTFIDVNDAWLRARGFEKHEVIGKTSAELNVWGSVEHRLEIVNELKRRGRLLNYETYAFTKTGGIRETIINAEVLNVRGKELMFLSGSDVTERNRLEKQLRRSQKLEAVGQLTGGIAHDFNNLMGIMMGNLELAMEQVEADAPLRKNIENALKAVDRGSALTQHLLSFSRQQALSPAVTDVKQLVEGTLTFLERTLGENIQVVTKHVGGESRVNIDAAVFSNALVNLALNARDAMPDGGTLTVQTANVELAGETIGLDNEPTYGSHALITVADTGRGISPDDLEQVLEPFFTTKEVGKGSGLGLSMVYGFVAQSNGHMNIVSKKEEGTIISIYLPISDEEPVDKDNEATPFSEANVSKTILLVEDDQQVRETTSATLLDLGHKVIEAEDGSSALEILSQRSSDIDLVLSDVVMPNGMSGIDLVKQIAIDHTHIKILLTSGYPDKIADQSEIKAMDIELLAKPFRRAQLAAAIENAVAGRAEN
ncbi:MAG: response regulator [Sneathiella sp.]|nr:response regulator [Sneathiella sp.]